jgi:Tfp pilus assembly protein PilN
MPIKNRQQLLALAAAVGVGLLVGDKLILTPLTASWKGRSRRITELTKSVNQGSLIVDREENIRSRWDQMRTNTLPASVSAAENEVLQGFERWSQASRISISSIKPQWKRGGDDFMTLECRADAFGSIQALTRFLYDLEKDPLALKVEAVEITARDSDGQQLTLGLQVSGLQLNAEAE